MADEQTQDDLGLGITDDQSSSSAEGKKEGEDGKGKEEGKDKGTLTKEQQEERVEFGRKTAKRLEAMEKTIADRFATTEETLGRFEQLLTRALPQDTPPERTDPDEEEYARYRRLRARERTDQLKYESIYLKKEDQIKDKDPVFHKQIHQEMKDYFNEVVTGNPEIDAELNYIKARDSLRAKKISALEKNRGGEPRRMGPTGISLGSQTGEGAEPEVTLPDDAERYIKARGLDPAFVKKALSDKA